MNKPVILCIDDEKIILETLKKQIKFVFGDRYRYEVAESAEEAWEVLREIEKDRGAKCMVLSDYLMPSIRGDQFLIEVHGKYPDFIKIMLTGQVDAGTLDRLQQELPLHRCLSKPWELFELIEAVESGMEKLCST
jgi:CheY-like chemotaxis protein